VECIESKQVFECDAILYFGECVCSQVEKLVIVLKIALGAKDGVVIPSLSDRAWGSSLLKEYYQQTKLYANLRTRLERIT